jgi:hypothetical protein
LHIELVATDGKIQKRVLWVSSTNNGVYSGYCLEGQDIHVTYHADGNIFNNLTGKTKKAFTAEPLRNFTGQQQLTCFGFSNIISSLRSPFYKLKKLDAIVSVDVRNYQKGVGCMVFLVETKSAALAELINSLYKANHPQITEIHSFLECNPWIAIVLYANLGA